MTSPGTERNPAQQRRDAARQRARTNIVATTVDSFEWRAFDRFCAANGRSAFPDTGDAGSGERLLVRYLHLHAQERHWKASYVRKVSGYISRHWQKAGHPDPRGLLWARLIKAIERSSAAPARPTDAFTEQEVVAIAEAIAAPRISGPNVLYAASVLLVARALGIGRPLAHAGHLVDTMTSLSLTDDRLTVDVSGEGRVMGTAFPAGQIIVDGLRELGVRNEHSHFLPGGSPDAMLDEYKSTPRPTRYGWLHSACRRGLARAIYVAREGAMDIPSARSFDDWWEAATTADQNGLIEHVLNRHLSRDLQDLAYFYTALTFGGRYAEMSRLRIGWLTETTDGYTGQIPANKHKGGLLAVRHGAKPEAIDLLVPHAPGHPPHCPACRLTDHLNQRRARGARPRDLVFLSARNTALPAQAATKILSRLLAAIETDQVPSSPRRIGTRSMRVTTATLARLKGLSIVEIAQLGHWKQLSTAERYIRVNDPVADQHLVLRMT